MTVRNSGLPRLCSEVQAATLDSILKSEGAKHLPTVLPSHCTLRRFIGTPSATAQVDVSIRISAIRSRLAFFMDISPLHFLQFNTSITISRRTCQSVA